MANIKELRKLPIPASLTRPIQLLGCDRVLLPAASLFCAYTGFILGLARGQIRMAAVAFVVWFICYRALIKMGKTDPYMREVASRSMRFSDKPFITPFFIPAKGSVTARTPFSVIKRGWL